VLECRIRKKLGEFALDLDFTAEQGITALMGASGSGKSMTLRCVAGVERPDEGEITLDGVRLFDSGRKINLPPQRRNTGFLFQDYALFPNMTALQNIMTGARGKPRRERARAAEELAEAFHITPHLKKYPYQLSGGEKQRAALARCLAASPDILMLDEPFSALDSHLRWELELEMAEVFKRFRKTVLYVSHNRDEVYRLCDSIIILNGGRNEAGGKKWELFKRPRTVQAARLTGCKNIFEFEGRLIGIRANYIVPAHLAKPRDMVFPFELITEIEDAFTYILMVRVDGLPPLRWEMTKEKREKLRELPQKLAFPQEHILLLDRR
jgi:molybdate transport system ATP-binding protein